MLLLFDPISTSLLTIGTISMALLSRDQILTAQDIPTEDVDVAEWGGTVRVRGLSGAERDAFEASITGSQASKKGQSRQLRLDNLRARFVAMSIVDDAGVRVFSDADIKALGGKSAAALERVYEVGQRLSGLSDDDVEEMAGNSDAAPRGDSTSG